MTDTTTSQESEIRLDQGDGDHDRFSHYVRKADSVSRDVGGVDVMALCGKKGSPHRDPDRYPICPTCQEIMSVLRGAGE